ncbi:MAG: hypothetical protein FJ125_11745, partial [Deltaproteobacteria bacterium]|nr:hypothetical protein [Deltaproteobacteria bacterium]
MAAVSAAELQQPAVLRVAVGSQVRVPADGLSWDVISRIKAQLCRPNPAYIKARHAGRPTTNFDQYVKGWSEEEGWDGPELVLPRGQAGQIIRCLRQAGLEVEVEREVSEGEPLEGVAFAGELRPYQEPA